VQDDAAILYREGELAEIRADATASDGAAVWMPGSHHEWALQIPVNKLPAAARTGRWKVYAVIRVQKKVGAPTAAAPTAASAFTSGVYDSEERVSRADAKATVAEAGDSYRSYFLGTVDFKPGQYVWVAPAANAEVEAIWVDRIYLVPVN